MATRKKQPAEPIPPEAAAAAAEGVVSAPLGSGFETEANSPFDDGYSIAAEEKALADFIAAGAVDEDDPLYDRYAELQERKERLGHARQKFEADRGADLGVSRSEARGIDGLGSLVDDDVDQMAIHTKEAYRLFMGRRRDPATHAAPITGGRRVASALRSLWLLTRGNNPYADWGLLRHEQVMVEMQQRLARETADAEALLQALQRKGLRFSVLRSARPRVLDLGFRSPYGYAISRLVADYDYFVRLQKTLSRKTLQSDDQTRAAIASVTRLARRIFNETTRFGNWLMREEVWKLSRNDFLPGADVEAKKRVRFVTEVFGVVPGDVFTGRLQPRHSQRHAQTTGAERGLLDAVAAGLETQADHAVEVEGKGEPESDANLV